MTSVLSSSWPRRTRRRYWFGKKSSRADKEFGNSSTGNIHPSGDGLAVQRDCRDSSSAKNGGPSRNSMTYSFQLSNLGRAGRKEFYLLLARPEPPRNGPSLIPAGDPYSSRGQRPRKMRPQLGPTPQARDRMRVTSPPSCGPPPKGIRPLQGRGTSVALSGSVAPGYYMVPLQGTKNLPFGLPRGTPLLTSRAAAFGHPCSE